MASSDLSHYHPYDEAVKLDHKTLNAIEEYDYFDLSRNFELQRLGGVRRRADRRRHDRRRAAGRHQAKVLHYANTGDVTGDHSRVVGYGAVALVKGAAGATQRRAAVFAHPRRRRRRCSRSPASPWKPRCGRAKPTSAQPGGLEALEQERGAFVTLTETRRAARLHRIRSAAQAAVCHGARRGHDGRARGPRFRPVTADELGDLEYEISVLSPLRRVLDIEEIRVGQHGLLIHKGDHEGLLLPQVPARRTGTGPPFWSRPATRPAFPPRAWQDADADLFRFTALVFGERKPLRTSLPLDLLRKPVALMPPAPGSPWPTAAPF